MKSLFISVVLIIGLELSAQTPTMNVVDDALEISQKNSSRKFSRGDQWQSFAPNTTGMFSIFRAYHYNESESGTLYVYEGEGTSGKLLYQQAYTANGTDFLFFRLNTPVPVVAGQLYTVRLSKFNWFVSEGDAYPAGTSSNSPGKDMMFEVYLTKPQPVLVNGEVSQATISHGKVQISDDSSEKYLKYIVNNLAPLPLGADGNSLINLKLAPTVSIKNDLLYVHFTSGSSGVDIRNYQNEWNDQKHFIFQIYTSIIVDAQSLGNTTPIAFELWNNGPTNLNKEGTNTDSNSLTLGLSGTDPGFSYTTGSSKSMTVSDFDFVNSSFGNQSGFSWTLSETSMESMVEKEAGQISALSPPPALSRSSFPLYWQTLYKSTKEIDTLPDFINVKLFTTVLLARRYLISNQKNAGEAFLNGLGFLFNPKTYSGELAYRIEFTPFPYINYVDIRLDLRPFKNRN